MVIFGEKIIEKPFNKLILDMTVAWSKEILTEMVRSDCFLDISQVKELPPEMRMSCHRKAVVKNHTKFLTSVIGRIQLSLPQIRKTVAGETPH